MAGWTAWTASDGGGTPLSPTATMMRFRIPDEIMELREVYGAENVDFVEDPPMVTVDPEPATGLPTGTITIEYLMNYPFTRPHVSSEHFNVTLFPEAFVLTTKPLDIVRRFVNAVEDLTEALDQGEDILRAQNDMMLIEPKMQIEPKPARVASRAQIEEALDATGGDHLAAAQLLAGAWYKPKDAMRKVAAYTYNRKELKLLDAKIKAAQREVDFAEGFDDLERERAAKKQLAELKAERKELLRFSGSVGKKRVGVDY